MYHELLVQYPNTHWCKQHEGAKDTRYISCTLAGDDTAVLTLVGPFHHKLYSSADSLNNWCKTVTESSRLIAK